jgi:hypothetical protein
VRALSSMRCPTHCVIPGRRAAASPESITTNTSDKITARDYGFRAPACGRPRNDRQRIAEEASSMDEDVIYGRSRHLCAGVAIYAMPQPRRHSGAPGSGEPGIHNHERLG